MINLQSKLSILLIEPERDVKMVTAPMTVVLHANVRLFLNQSWHSH
jgi:hypothetical protein